MRAKAGPADHSRETDVFVRKRFARLPEPAITLQGLAVRGRKSPRAKTGSFRIVLPMLQISISAKRSVRQIQGSAWRSSRKALGSTTPFEGSTVDPADPQGAVTDLADSQERLLMGWDRCRVYPMLIWSLLSFRSSCVRYPGRAVESALGPGQSLARRRRPVHWRLDKGVSSTGLAADVSARFGDASGPYEPPQSRGGPPSACWLAKV